ncbi:hypothetical protein RJT34_00292 [Clitoria ternatea]|uniref:2-oxoacid dehydrogenase acyltransferase catalytic domain-containing protein n=1 Tax=Clitoria ternatea TaxID=43366 RepID=A0AAN9KGZ4_CLITE
MIQKRLKLILIGDVKKDRFRMDKVPDVSIGIDLNALSGYMQLGDTFSMVDQPVTFVATGNIAPSSTPVLQKSEAVGAMELGSVFPFTTIQSAVSRNMLESLAVPTFRVGYIITTDALYKKMKLKGVTMTTLLAKAIAHALVKHLIMNSSCRDGNSFTYNNSINIAVTMATDDGLITLVLQDADKVDVYSLSRK